MEVPGTSRNRSVSVRKKSYLRYRNDQSKCSLGAVIYREEAASQQTHP